MVDTTDAVRRDIEMTRERMSTTLAQLEQKVNLVQRVRDHPWPALGAAFGTGVVLGVSAGTRGRPRAAATAVTRGSGGRLSGIAEEIIGYLLRALRDIAESQIDNVVADLKVAMRNEGPAGSGRESRPTESRR
jgi:hypothetical protein